MVNFYSTIVGDFKMLANFGQSFVGMTPEQIYSYIPLFISPFLETISAELSTLENIFCAFLAENIFVKVLIQDL